jgi:hypothetical protein
MGDNEFPVPDPFLDENMIRHLKLMQNLYAGMMQVGFPEQRAFELVRDVFLTQITTAVNAQTT